MKSSHRPPLNLTDPEPGEGLEESAPIMGADDERLNETPVEFDAELSLPPAPDKPMSERRRRRLLEEQRLADERAAALLQAENAPDLPPLAVSADAPPAVVEDAAPPASVASRRAPALKSGGNAYLIAGLASALWIGGVASWFAYEFGSGAVALEPLRLAVYALIALAPAGLAIMLAHAVRQGASLALETRRARDMAEALVGPTALAAHQTGQVLTSLRGDIDQAALAAERARNDMALLREALAQETVRLNEAAESAGRTARRLTDQLGREREQMGALGVQLDSQATGVVDAVERQSRMVVDASDLAQTQLREAEAALAARAADLAAAANEAQDAARAAADDLARQTLRLETAGTGVAEQIQSVEEGLSQQRASLVTAAYALRTDQEDFSAQIESQRAQFTEQLSLTRTAAGELNQTTGDVSDALKAQVEAVTDQFRALVDLSQREADGFDHATKLALDRFEALAAEARDLLVEETRRALSALQATAEDQRAAAAAAIEQAQIRADRLGESLFDAAQKADEAAEARIDGARKIVNQTADMVDLTGEKVVERLEGTLERMTAALTQVEHAVAEMDARADRLPQEAAARVDAVRASVEHGLAALSAASKKAAEDTEALETGFQDRVRRNYEMLTEAVRVMGVVSGDTPASRRREPLLSAAAPETPRYKPRAVEPKPEPKAADDRGFGLRGRLRLEPTEDAPPPPAKDEPLDWNDLGETVAGHEAPLELDAPVPAAVAAPVDAAALANRVTAAIRRMGVDPNALLPRARIEEAARALALQEPDRARQIVRRVAPAAVRSVSRRILADAELRADADAYVRAFGLEMQDHARRGDAHDVQARLATDEGRAFMLLDAAIGDLG
ncbi:MULTISPECIES: tipN [unclassified Brevundimonas]|uniref:tipN n=1 Tax=unclassified Brevundimonas TaxID=2622653 RepID=UPI000CFC7FAE|nr:MULTISPECIES: tipN [unclassified Brevundimonas]PRA30944.1 tipN [Brevundimonas sp. MYb27]PQZ82798.1 tipN [Brevundimonas sp. MYb31]PRB16807.1 tipN [Brevundimonas sp. MYb52]PRB34657.1 tipN [Brevundimonas sp. MYb46]PRB54778.1 tipN [Brevundimonas sp. MYb33]